MLKFLNATGIQETLAVLPSWYVALTGFVLGGILASFFGVVLYRTPRGLGLGGRSVCVCSRQLKFYENVPVLGWLALKGRTRCCKQKIPYTMFVQETLVAFIFAVAGARGLQSLLIVFVVSAVSIALVWVRLRLTRDSVNTGDNHV